MLRFLTALALAGMLFPAPRAQAADFTGYAEVEGALYAQRHDTGDPWAEGVATLLGKLEDRVGNGAWTASFRLEDRSSGEAGTGFDPADRKTYRSPLSAQELWLRFPAAGGLDLQVGRMHLGWGKTDGYSPADAFLPRDLTDPFADEKLPLWGLRMTGQWDWLRAEALYVPVTTPWRLPQPGSRFAPVDSRGLAVRDGEEAPPLPGFGTLRLLATAQDWDVGVWSRYGVQPSPLLEPSLEPDPADPLHPILVLHRRYVHEGGAGIEVSRLAGAWIFRAEAAQLFTRDDAVGDALLWAASAERGWGEGTLLLTFADSAGERGTGSARLFDRYLLPALITAWNQEFPWGHGRAVWTWGTSHGDGMLEGEILVNLTDAWGVTAGGELPYGSEDAPLGALHDARRLRLALRYAW